MICSGYEVAFITKGICCASQFAVKILGMLIPTDLRINIQTQKFNKAWVVVIMTFCSYNHVLAFTHIQGSSHSYCMSFFISDVYKPWSNRSSSRDIRLLITAMSSAKKSFWSYTVREVINIYWSLKKSKLVSFFTINYDKFHHFDSITSAWFY